MGHAEHSKEDEQQVSDSPLQTDPVTIGISEDEADSVDVGDQEEASTPSRRFYANLADL